MTIIYMDHHIVTHIRIIIYGQSYTESCIDSYMSRQSYMVIIYKSSYTNRRIQSIIYDRHIRRSYTCIIIYGQSYGQSYTSHHIRTIIYGSSYGLIYASSYTVNHIRSIIYGNHIQLIIYESP